MSSNISSEWQFTRQSANPIAYSTVHWVGALMRNGALSIATAERALRRPDNQISASEREQILAIFEEVRNTAPLPADTEMRMMAVLKRATHKFVQAGTGELITKVASYLDRRRNKEQYVTLLMLTQSPRVARDIGALKASLLELHAQVMIDLLDKSSIDLPQLNRSIHLIAEEQAEAQDHEKPLSRRAQLFKHMPRLVRFNAIGATAEDLPEFAPALEKLDRFTTLDVTGMLVDPANRSVTPAALAPYREFLQHLVIDSKVNRVSFIVDVLKSLKTFPKLTALTLNNWGTDDEIKAISELVNLEELTLTDGLEARADLIRSFEEFELGLPNLRKLKINFPFVNRGGNVLPGNRAVRKTAIEAISKMTQLRSLDLTDSNPLDDADLMNLAAIPLEEINLSNCTKYTPEGILAFLAERKSTIKVVTLDFDFLGGTTDQILDTYPHIIFKKANGEVMQRSKKPAVATSSSSSRTYHSASAAAAPSQPQQGH